jgi:hypothetical protein
VNRGLRYAPQSFTPVPGSTLHLGGVGKNRIGKGQPSVSSSSGAPLYFVAPVSAFFNESAGIVEFTITRADTSKLTTVYVSTVHDQGTDNPNGDYYYDGLRNQPVTFAIGASTAQVSLTINDLGLTSGAEAFRIIVQQNSGDPPTTFLASSTFTILNNDLPPASTYQITPATSQVNENAAL